MESIMLASTSITSIKYHIFHNYAYWIDSTYPPLNGRVRDWDLYDYDGNTNTYSINQESLPDKARYVRTQLDTYGLTNIPILYLPNKKG